MFLLLIANGMTAVGLAAGIEIASMAIGSDALWLALLVGFAAWLTFSATTLLQHNAFELKPVRLTLLNSAYQLVFPRGSMTNCSRSRAVSSTSAGTACTMWTKVLGRRCCCCTATQPGRSTTAR
ncbi:Uncharacterised protein [Mycobacteroides abscessus subsp. massiliense]|nr:Uncharacterised protein [Mycobacteroides abscessus subsp. massiliense]